jgi:hypothetical protein
MPSEESTFMRCRKPIATNTTQRPDPNVDNETMRNPIRWVMLIFSPFFSQAALKLGASRWLLSSGS